MFELSFKNGNNDPTRDSFDLSLTEIKYFNALIDNKPYFDQPVKNKQEAYEKLIKMLNNNDCITGKYYYLYYQKYYKLIGTDLSRQTNTNTS